MTNRLKYHPLGPGWWPLSSKWRPAHRPGHRGVDVPVFKANLYASIDGIATRHDEPGGAGYWVQIATPNGHLWVRQFHMSRIIVPHGTQVRAGDLIGVSGGVPGEPGAGNTDGAHLHFEIWEGGVDTDPEPDLTAVQDVQTPQADIPSTPIVIPNPPKELIDMAGHAIDFNGDQIMLVPHPGGVAIIALTDGGRQALLDAGVLDKLPNGDEWGEFKTQEAKDAVYAIHEAAKVEGTLNRF